MTKEWLEEQKRLSVLESLDILDTLPEWQFDCLTSLAAHIFQTPMSALSLIDERRQWFKSKVGLNVSETPRGDSFCQHTILSPEPLVVQDATTDPRFAKSPLVEGEPNIRFYAGVPVYVWGQNVGALCVIDRRVHQPSHYDLGALALLANLAASMMQMSINLRQKEQWIDQLTAQIKDLEKLAS